MLNKSRVWSLLDVSFLVGLRTYQHPLVVILSELFIRFDPNTYDLVSVVSR